MAFRDFRYPDVIDQLGLTERPVLDLYGHVPSVAPGELLRATLPTATRLGPGAHSEVARMIWMVGPVLQDLWERYAGRISVNAGVELDGDADARLTGVCDFAISRAPQRPYISAPVLVIAEAKRDSIPDGLGQCIAEMVGAQRFNRREGKPVEPVYGCATTGSLWRFAELAGTTVTVDLAEYTLSQVDRLLGILVHMVGPVPPLASA